MYYILYVHFRLQRVIMNSQNNLFFVGLIAQLVEHCSGITEAIPEQARLESRSSLNFSDLLSLLLKEQFIYDDHVNHDCFCGIFLFKFLAS